MNHSQVLSRRFRSSRLDLELLEERCLLAAGYGQVNLASDVPGLARVTDPNLVNPWGISFSPTGPFWFANAGTGTSTLLDGRGNRFDLVVSIPGATGEEEGEATGTAFNAGPDFLIRRAGRVASSQFLFATEDGTISGWAPRTGGEAVVAIDNSAQGASYKGLALVEDADEEYTLYAANFAQGTIDVFDEYWQPIHRAHAFEDPNLPQGFAPFNIHEVGDLLFVTYARQDAEKYDDVAGPGNGFVNVFDTEGNFVRRFASQGTLDSPWGIAQAPADFGPFGGALLVGNTGDGRISAFDPRAGSFMGQLADEYGSAIVIPTLWALTFGNGHVGGNADTLFFAAGIGDGNHGLFGAIQAPQWIGRDTAGSGIFDPLVDGERADYPLPPRLGPTLQGGEETARPVSVLLPLSQSSLALVPTLSTVTMFQPGANNQAVQASLDPANGTALTMWASNVALMHEAGAETPTAQASRGTFVTLDRLLNSNALALVTTRLASFIATTQTATPTVQRGFAQTVAGQVPFLGGAGDFVTAHAPAVSPAAPQQPPAEHTTLIDDADSEQPGYRIAALVITVGATLAWGLSPLGPGRFGTPPAWQRPLTRRNGRKFLAIEWIS